MRFFFYWFQRLLRLTYTPANMVNDRKKMGSQLKITLTWSASPFSVTPSPEQLWDVATTPELLGDQLLKDQLNWAGCCKEHGRCMTEKESTAYCNWTELRGLQVESAYMLFSQNIVIHLNTCTCWCLIQTIDWLLGKPIWAQLYYM